MLGVQAPQRHPSAVLGEQTLPVRLFHQRPQPEETKGLFREAISAVAHGHAGEEVDKRSGCCRALEKRYCS